MNYAVTDSIEFHCYFSMATRIEKSYNINILCTDAYDVYGKYKLALRHVITKAETALVEFKNSLINYILLALIEKLNDIVKLLI